MNQKALPEVEECPTCGRCSQNWGEEGSKAVLNGVKARQHASQQDRSLPYRDWRRTIGRSLYVNDIDQLEWRVIDGEIKPVAIIELTRVNGNISVPQSYLDSVLKRITQRDPQSKIACMVADSLNVCAYVVVWRWDLSEFFVYNLTKERGWKYWSPLQYEKWIGSLKHDHGR